MISAASPDSPGERRRLATLAGQPHKAVAVVVPATTGSAPLGRTFTVERGGWLRIDGIDPSVRPHRLDEADAHIVVTPPDLAAQHGNVVAGHQGGTDVARRQSGAEDDTSSSTPPTPRTSPNPTADLVDADHAPLHPPGPVAVRRVSALLDEVDVLVRVLGEVEAVRLAGPAGAGVRGEERLVPTRHKALEAIAYLALRVVAVDREDLEINLFPDGANAAKTVYQTVNAARMLVGEELFPPVQVGPYQLSERVVTDYRLFCDLAAQADEVDDVELAAELLTDALELVRGEPFIGVGRHYAWAGPHRVMIVAQVVDAAEELAEIRLAQGDWQAAEWAARRGLRALPSDERMYRLLMRAARAAGTFPA